MGQLVLIRIFLVYGDDLGRTIRLFNLPVEQISLCRYAHLASHASDVRTEVESDRAECAFLDAGSTTPAILRVTDVGFLIFIQFDQTSRTYRGTLGTAFAFKFVNLNAHTAFLLSWNISPF